MKKVEYIGLHEMSVLDYRELASGIEDLCEYKPQSPSEAEHGDLTAGVVLLTLAPPALFALAAFLLRKIRKTEITMKVQRFEADGSGEVREIHLRHTEADSPDAEVLRELGKGLGVDLLKIAQRQERD